MKNELVIYDQKGKKVGATEADAKIFSGNVNKALIWQAVRMFQANKRTGAASTKVRSEVAGGGKKPWRQKGTGRARVGSSRNPVWVGGGISGGPKPKDYSYSINRKAKVQALIAGLNLKLTEGHIKLVDNLKLDKPKTKDVVNLLKSLKLDDSTLILVSDNNKVLYLSGRNIPKVDVKSLGEVSAMDILKHEFLVATKDAFDGLVKKLKK